MTEQEFRQALTRGLSGEMSHRTRGRILKEIEGGKPIMKKKISLAVVLAVLLTLLTTAALAIGLTGYFEDAARLQKESGYYDTWGLSEKQALIASMKENGLIDDEIAASLTDEAAIDAYLIERYGVQGRDDTIGLDAILEKELGPIDTWSAETKAWYTTLLQDAGLLTSNDVVYLNPSNSPLKPEEIVRLAQQVLEDVWDMAPGTLDRYNASWTYEEMDATDGTRIKGYGVSFSTEDKADGSYSCALTETGEIIDGHRVTALYSPAQQKALAEERKGRDEELRKAFNDYTTEDKKHLLETAKSRAFEDWPLEAQQDFTETVRPVIEQRMAADLNYSDALGLFIVSHRYGVPGEGAIAQEEAIRIAQEALTGTMGMDAKKAAIFTNASVLYDVTDPDAPLWKVILSPASQAAAREAQVSLWQRRRVVINALTSEVVETKAFSILNGDTEAETLELTY